MAKKVILAIDQSTAGTKCVIFSAEAKIVSKKLIPHQQIYPESGWVEHNPMEIYSNVVLSAEQALKAAGMDYSDVEAIALSNQRETVVVWDRLTGDPIYNAIVWQDSRSESICNRVSNSFEYLREVTGLEPSPYFSGPKIAWILENVEGAREKAAKGELAFGTMDSFLLWKLTGGTHKCDVTNASRTLLMDLSKIRWDEGAMELFGIPISMAPQIVLSDSVNEATSAGSGFPQGIPVASMIGDSHAALFGQCCFDKGSSKATYGTGSSVMMNTGSAPVRSGYGLVSSVAYGIKGEVNYCLEGNINTTGGITKWMVEVLGLMDSASMSGKISSELPDNGGVYFVPALTGLAAPYWKSNARAAFVGMTSSTTVNHLIRAGEEAIAYQVADVVRAMEKDIGSPLTELRVDGGPTRDSFLMDFQSAVLGKPVETCAIEELSALGAAFIAGLATGLYSSVDDICLLRPAGKAYNATDKANDAASTYYSEWKSAVNKII